MRVRMGMHRPAELDPDQGSAVVETIGLSDVQMSDADGLKWAKFALQSEGDWAMLLCDKTDEETSGWLEVAAGEPSSEPLPQAKPGPEAQLEFVPGGPLVLRIFSGDGRLSATLEVPPDGRSAITLRDPLGQVIWQAS